MHHHHKEEQNQKEPEKISAMKFSWDWVFAIFLIALTTYVAINTFPLKQLPGPLYGGDIYFHFSNVMHIFDGGSIFKSGAYLNEWQYYSWLMYGLIYIFAKVFFLSPMRAAILFPIVIFAVSMIVNYLLAQKIFKKKETAIVFSVACAFIPISTPTSLSNTILIPLMLFTYFILFKQEFSIKKSVFAGIIYGILGLGHVAAFLAINLFLIIMIIAELLNKTSFKQVFKKYGVVFAIGIPISLLYWASLIFVYHGITLNPWQTYASYGSAGKGTFILQTLKSTFSDFSSIKTGLITLLLLTGLLSFILLKKKEPLPLMLFLTGIIGLLHPYITEPLFHTSLGYYGFASVLAILRIILAFYGLTFIQTLLKKNKMLITSVAAVVFIIFFVQGMNSFRTDKWTSAGYSLPEYMQVQLNFSEYIRNIVPNNEAILTLHEETGFAINALTGKKVLFMRRTHASQFVDFDQRAADAAIILYGNNSALKNELLKKYSIKYLYLDYYSIQSVNECNLLWANFSNSAYAENSYSCMRVLPKYEEYLNDNGVVTQQVTARLDVAFAQAEKTTLTLIKPDFTEFSIVLLKTAEVQNQTLFALYRLT